jgi:putative transposase
MALQEKAYKYRFYPTSEQAPLLKKTIGCVRLVYNKALAARTEAWHERQESISYCQTSRMLTAWKKEESLQFLNEVSCVPLQQGLRHLQRAFVNFWEKRAKYPRFKKKRNGGSAEFTKSAFRWKDGKLFLAKCDQPLDIVWSRPLPDGVEPSTVTVTIDAAGRWFVSLRVEENVETLPPRTEAVGLDAGITSLVTLSTGEKIANPKTFDKHYRRLRNAQKKLSRKEKASRNREKARRKVAKIHNRIKDTRLDHLHKVTTRLVRENQTIVIEDLSVRSMVKNRKLARAISDCGWGELVRQLEYKCRWYGRTLVKIDRYYPSSKRCSSCGYIAEKMPLSIREWECPECGTHHDRDWNAAKNILAAGHAVSVCGATVRPKRSNSGRAGAMKQKA